MEYEDLFRSESVVFTINVTKAVKLLTKQLEDSRQYLQTIISEQMMTQEDIAESLIPIEGRRVEIVTEPESTKRKNRYLNPEQMFQRDKSYLKILGESNDYQTFYHIFNELSFAENTKTQILKLCATAPEEEVVARDGDHLVEVAIDKAYYDFFLAMQ